MAILGDFNIVRISPAPPRRRKLCIACDALFILKFRASPLTPLLRLLPKNASIFGGPFFRGLRIVRDGIFMLTHSMPSLTRSVAPAFPHKTSLCGDPCRKLHIACGAFFMSEHSFMSQTQACGAFIENPVLSRVTVGRHSASGAVSASFRHAAPFP